MKELIGALVQVGQDLPILAWIYGLMYAARAVLHRGPGRSTALGRWLSGLQSPQRGPGGPADRRVLDDPEEAMAFRLLAESLVNRLDLRPGSQEAVLAELGRERELVLAWLARQARPREFRIADGAPSRQESTGSDGSG